MTTKYLFNPASTLSVFLVFASAAWVSAHDDESTTPTPPSAAGGIGSPIVQSQSGTNAWNEGKPSEDWWEEIRRQHGHVGPWNVLGWRIGQAALREFQTKWGLHDLEIVCYMPMQTPFTCLVDGLSVGTGNSSGRLDLRLAEVLIGAESFVAVRRKDLKGDVVEFRPQSPFIKSIINRPLEKLDELSRQTITKPEQELFTIKRISP